MKHPFTRETLEFIRSVGFGRPGKWIHGYIYGAYTQAYLTAAFKLARRAPFIPEFAKKYATASYRGKVTTLEDAKKLVTLHLDTPIEHLERILPLKEAVDVVYQTGDSIYLVDCPCRKLKENPCRPTEVCLIMGEPFASFVARQQSDLCRRITQEEAVRVLEETERLGWTHVTFNRDVAGDRFYAICNCCKCCCCGMIVQRELGVKVIHQSGYRATVGEECSGCGTCEGVCQFEAIRLGPEETAVIDYGKCLACGACASNCPEEAITLEEAAEGLKPLRLWD